MNESVVGEEDSTSNLVPSSTVLKTPKDLVTEFISGFLNNELFPDPIDTESPDLTDYEAALAEIRMDVITQWIDDLSSRDYGIKFHADYPIMRLRGKLCGDAALFLAYRHADINDNDPDALFSWYAEYPCEPGGFHASECILSKFTGIPLEDACKLVWPAVVDPEGFDVNTITAKDFIKVLKAYLEDGEVNWGLIMEDRRKMYA